MTCVLVTPGQNISRLRQATPRPIEADQTGAHMADLDARDAVRANNEAALRDALGRGADVNFSWVEKFNEDDEDDLGDPITLLTYAVHLGHDGLCKILMAAGADPNLAPGTDENNSPLHFACAPDPLVSPEQAMACVRSLLDAGADVNGRDFLGASPLHYACGCGEPQSGKEYRLAQILLSHGANIEVKTVRGSTPLKIALVNGRRKEVLTLLRAGAALKVLNHRHVKDRNAVALQDYLVDIVNDGGWDAHARKHHDLLLGVVSKCVRLPQEVMSTIASYWSLPH